MPGPAPKPEGQRRNRRPAPGFVHLPESGRTGRVPGWPLVDGYTEPVRLLWRSLWRKPQAIQWERLGMERIVARYALKVLEAERPDASNGVMGEARQFEDRLGLSPMALLRLRWEIVPDADAERPDAPVTDLGDYRDALAN